MVSMVRCLVPYKMWSVLLLFVLSVGGVSHCAGRIGRGYSWGVATTFWSCFAAGSAYRIARSFGFWSDLLIEASLSEH